MRISVLGVPIDAISVEAALDTVSRFFHRPNGAAIFTPNPEMLVDASSDAYFHEILQTGDLNLCDGRGIELLVRRIPERIPGVDFMERLCLLAAQQGRRVYLLGSGDIHVLKRCAEALTKDVPTLRIVGMHPGPLIRQEDTHGRRSISINRDEHNEILADIIMTAPDILFVGFGHGKQEKWIAENKAHLPSVKVYMGVGGAFDFLSGKAVRAPHFLRILGLEWLWRLLYEPRRIKRICKAVIVFPLLYLIKQPSYGKQ